MAKKQTRASKIRKFIIDNPTAKTAAIAKLFDTRYQNVYAVRRKMETEKIAKEENWQNLAIASTMVPITKDAVTGISPKRLLEVAYELTVKPDAVNHPAHYKVGGIETIDFIEAKSLDYNLGNVVKYVTRADHKGNKLEDLRKAQWYLTRAIETAK